MIGFEQNTYTVVEGTDLFVNLSVQLISGQLEEEVIVKVNTENVSAKGKGMDK